MKVAIVATHPIQYHIPWFRELARQPDIDLTVYFALMPNPEQQGVGFGVPFAWDIPLLDGYHWVALDNTARKPGLTGFFSSSIPGIFHVFRKSRPDVVILNGWQSLPLFQAMVACILLKIPRIVRGESSGLRKRHLLMRLFHRLLLKNYHGFLAIGQANKAFYRVCGIDNRKIFFSRYFVDNEHFLHHYRQYMHQQDKIRKKWKIPKNKVCFVYSGKLVPKKRIFDLLMALEIASRQRTDLHLLVVGTGELKAKAKAYACEHRLPVTFTGFLNQTALPKTYIAGDCLVLPSDYGETWGLVVNEAMVCGLPAVVSDRVGCGPDLIIEGNTGYTFPFGDIEALARRMIELAKRPEKIRTMGKKAQKHIQAYSVENTVKGTLQAIEFVTRNTRIDRH